WGRGRCRLWSCGWRVARCSSPSLGRAAHALAWPFSWQVARFSGFLLAGGHHWATSGCSGCSHGAHFRGPAGHSHRCCAGASHLRILHPSGLRGRRCAGRRAGL
ncbi:unnamed protein product, partial [Polarella glacialis]